MVLDVATVTNDRSQVVAPVDGAADAIVATDLRRVFRKRKGWFRSGEEVVAVKGVSFAVPRGTIFGLLGPNGAGKTTTIKMLSTLLLPTRGTATVAGYDVVRDAHQVRQLIGLTGQYASVDEDLTGTENLVLLARLLDAELWTADERLLTQLAGRAPWVRPLRSYPL